MPNLQCPIFNERRGNLVKSSLRVLGLIGLLALSVSAALADDAAPAGKATTPKQCIESMVAAGKKEDFDRMCSYMVEPYRSHMPKMLTVGTANEKAEADLRAALDGKFGAGSADAIGMRAGGGMKRPM